MALFHVVEFVEETEEGSKGPVAVVPDSWLLASLDAGGRRFCYWPPPSVKADDSFIIRAKKPDSSWILYPVRLHKTLNNYQDASRLCERLMDTSEVETDDPNSQPTKRMRKAPSRFRDAQESGSDEEDDEAPPSCDSLGAQKLPYTLPPVPVVGTSFRMLSPASSQKRTSPLPPVPVVGTSFRMLSPASSQKSTSPLPPVPVVGTSSRMLSPASSSKKTTVSPLPSRLQRLPIPLSGSRATIENRYPLEANQVISTSEVVSLLVEVRNFVKDIHRRMVQREVRQQEQTTRGELPAGYHFPIQAAEEVERLDWDLHADPEKKTRLVCYLALRGGYTLKHLAKAVLAVLFSTQLARTYNYNGMKGKRGLKNHPFVLQTIQDAVRKQYPEATDHDIRVEITSWLAGARDREYGRRERALQIFANCPEVEEPVEELVEEPVEELVEEPVEEPVDL